jgi:nicotinamidase-related amidase
MAGEDAAEESEPRDGHHSPSERLCAPRQDGDSRRSERDCVSTRTIDRVKKGKMATRVYEKERTALLFIDPYNDFLSEGGKLWPRVEEVARKVGLLENLRAISSEMRGKGFRVFIAPHRRWQPGDFESWTHPTPYQLASAGKQVFAAGSWGGEWHPDFAPQPDDVVVKDHWASSSFANTDLDVLLRQHGITHLVAIGLLANTCVEVTSRYAAELGYHVTLVKDATAAYSEDRMHAAHELNGPTYAHSILTTAELLAALRRDA